VINDSYIIALSAFFFFFFWHVTVKPLNLVLDPPFHSFFFFFFKLDLSSFLQVLISVIIQLLFFLKSFLIDLPSSLYPMAGKYSFESACPNHALTICV
jgi:hypothetical protein